MELSDFNPIQAKVTQIDSDLCSVDLSGREDIIYIHKSFALPHSVDELQELAETPGTGVSFANEGNTPIFIYPLSAAGDLGDDARVGEYSFTVNDGSWLGLQSGSTPDDIADEMTE